eukprot:TRINITY_DN11122_c0_g1_i1.p1 TRINITY_DN11122_c0_g1~~TRINITY_DN11122_c0_g1_i1.p1  ORF type:complete len:493 (+),score=81.50 TRINITY_DN11122_c0_g1_i1:160-1479(+)
MDAMKANGLRDVGYDYVNLDDCVVTGRFDNGTLYTDPKGFPSGTLKPLTSYAHKSGFLFGTYTDRGTKTCAGRPGALGFEDIDAQTYADWGIDYLKEDSCNAIDSPDMGYREYARMRDALNATGRPIFFSLCGWHDWYAPKGMELGNSWRVGPDDTDWNGVLTNININSKLASYAGPGGWNDPCLLLSVDRDGKPAVTELQSRAQFNMWAIMASPLLISGSVLRMSNYTLETYTNKQVIAVNQDSLGKQGIRVAGGDLSATGSTTEQVWLEPCSDSSSQQQWNNDTPSDGYWRNSATNRCLNVNDCGSAIIAFDCITTGGTCCGSDCYDNLKFQLLGNGTLTTPSQPGMCVNATMAGPTLVPCMQATTWSHTSEGQVGAARSGLSLLSINLSDACDKVARMACLAPAAHNADNLAFVCPWLLGNRDVEHQRLGSALAQW